MLRYHVKKLSSDQDKFERYLNNVKCLTPSTRQNLGISSAGNTTWGAQCVNQEGEYALIWKDHAHPESIYSKF